MIYEFFDEESGTALEELSMPNWPVPTPGEKIALIVNDRESLYELKKLSAPNFGANNRISIKAWVTDMFPKK
ncbi:hypothetical protein GKN94_11320 [Candidatus Lucifugimonas marina]|uniref:hypothetical protein n=1 Tax=Candidatus Lucifugimonas marina TaxID=3038979 RepID=UPI002799B875|nr:hypothetical protein GKN94_11320 [SAR202 cluster bacterium JH545]